MSRKMVRCFDKKYLSPQGFFVDIEDREVKLPDGEIIDNGLLFRNNFHLDKRSAADIFVPCGGRPEAVHVNNVQMLFDNGVPRFKAIVEGANLFFTQGARKELESRGVILYKDSSANKGGVTSSSLEGKKLCSFVLDDYQFLLLLL
jgi:glutamate dehydrogenase